MDQQECVRVDSGTGVTQKLSTDFIRVVPQTSRNRGAYSTSGVRMGALHPWFTTLPESSIRQTMTNQDTIQHDNSF